MQVKRFGSNLRYSLCTHAAKRGDKENLVKRSFSQLQRKNLHLATDFYSYLLTLSATSVSAPNAPNSGMNSCLSKVLRLWMFCYSPVWTDPAKLLLAHYSECGTNTQLLRVRSRRQERREAVKTYIKHDKTIQAYKTYTNTYMTWWQSTCGSLHVWILCRMAQWTTLPDYHRLPLPNTVYGEKGLTRQNRKWG